MAEPATARRSQTDSGAGVKFPPPLMFISALAVGLVLEEILPSETIPSALSWPLGAVLLGAGLGLLLWFQALFNRAGTAVEPWKPTSAIVTDGPYRFTRNPAYVGMTLVYAGIAVLCKALWPFALLVVVLVVVDRAVIAREERYLEREFGEEYLAYKRTVRRWL